MSLRKLLCFGFIFCLMFVGIASGAEGDEMKEEAALDKPGIVSVITREEIERSGARTLHELLNRLPGVLTMGSYLMPQNIVSVRGDLATHYDNHVLTLINGRPFRESAFGGNKTSLYNSFPVSVIERIEFTRGPSSAVHGTGAFSGVINIITKSADGVEPQSRIDLTTGTFDAYGADVSMSSSSENLSVNIGAKYFRNDGWTVEAVDEQGISGSGKFGEDNIGVSLFGDSRGLTFGGVFLRSIQDHFGSVVAWPEQEIDTEKIFMTVGYEKAFSDAWNPAINLTYTRLDSAFMLVPGPHRQRADDYLLELVNRSEVLPSLSILYGGTVELLTGELTTELTATGGKVSDVPEYEETRGTVFTEIDYDINDSLSLVCGIQGNQDEYRSWEMAPRACAILKATDTISIKAMYNEAYRNPAEGELNIFVPNVLTGNPDLEPETVETLNLQVNYLASRLFCAITGFQSTQRDLITRQADPAGTGSTYLNAGKIDSHGVEVEIRYEVTDNLLIDSSYLYQENDNDGVDDYFTTPNNLLKLGIAYLCDRSSLNIFGEYMSNAHEVDVRNPAVQVVNPEADAFFMVSASARIDISSWLAFAGSDATYFTVGIYNLLDEETHMPEFNRSRINTLPYRPGRNITVGVSAEF